MADGFLGYRTSFMLDFVVCALVVIVPLLLVSLYEVKFRKNFVRHRNLQILLCVVLLVAVGAFEVDMQWVQGGWENVVAKQLEANGGTLTDAQLAPKVASGRTVLRIHLIFAISTPILWIITLVNALRKFPNPAAPGPHSKSHKLLGWISTLDITATSVTGVWFYYVAFIT